MPETFVFDQPHARRYVDAREAWLKNVLPELMERLKLRTAIDVGCGVGYFSEFLRGLGLEVTAVDGRGANIEEARSRHPGIKFECLDVQGEALRELGSFDLVFCFGLIYHLENPLAALRSFEALTGTMLLIEGICIPGERPYFLLRDEPRQEDQSLTPLALYPSESGLIKACYRMGFPFVWRVTRFPEHEDFVASRNRKRFRTIVAASRVPLESSFFELAGEPVETAGPWDTQRDDIRARINGFVHLPWRDKMRVLQRKLSFSERS